LRVRISTWATSHQPFLPPGSVNEYQLRLGRQRQVWLIPIADDRTCGCAGKTVKSLENTCHTERFCDGDSLRRGAISNVCTFTFTLPSLMWRKTTPWQTALPFGPCGCPKSMGFQSALYKYVIVIRKNFIWIDIQTHTHTARTYTQVCAIKSMSCDIREWKSKITSNFESPPLFAYSLYNFYRLRLRLMVNFSRVIPIVFSDFRSKNSLV